MKFTYILCCILLGPLLISTAVTLKTSNKSMPSVSEEEAIKKVIISETEAFWDKDFQKLSNCWVHDDYVRVVGWWEHGGVTVRKGWSVIGDRMEKLIKENPEKNRQNVARENFNIRISGNMAWVTFEQYGTDTGEKAMDMPGLSYETRILEKHNGQWRIAYVGWLLDGRKKN
ncbi:nuclear transport factor 2 family protein [Chryseolinea sp. H1M3-3]|uniref:nuclear transport factor 2 family protein n=1 Tax=Chryseolinea sp. H1M3-3 TaxID=3034144 RepID=UPI0023EC3E8A|nr:nuclear transport factor 2 family protein [Chryseolinea sp. H1M3-3]